jgi:xanthine dehydrogenase large subunit
VKKYNKNNYSGSPHDSGLSHVTGESIFIDDRPELAGELHVSLVLSTRAHAKIVKIDSSKALLANGVVGVYTASDFKNNIWGPIIKDQPLLADQLVSHYSEPLAVVVAETRKVAYASAKLVEVHYKDLTPVFSVDEAIKGDHFLGDEFKIEEGDIEKAFSNSDHILEGTFENGGQDHFYLESQACIAYPGENNELHIESSSQHPTEVQHVVAGALGLKQNKVVCVVKRMGGGFGGKESQASHMAALAALAASKTKRPCRLVLTKDEDMKITGKRHPFKNWYKIGFNKDGKIKSLKVNFFADGGAYLDLSPAILQRAMFHVDNAYQLENALITGRVVKTNRSPNTAFRGFGGPQGAAVIESLIEDISQYLKIDSLDIRKLNLYSKDKAVTHYGQSIKDNFLPEVFKELEEKVDYKKWRKQIDEFNRNETSYVKGLALTATKFGISFTSRFLNQANALVNVHTDGTVQVSTGATEMGQGVNTKIQGIVSEAFGIDSSDIKLMATSTEKNHNTSATAASSGSDLNGAAALMACVEIKENLAKLALQIEGNLIKEGDEYDSDMDLDISEVRFEKGLIITNKSEFAFKELVSIAFFNRINLGARAHYKTPEIHYDPVKGKGRPFLYFTNGAAVSEVLIDKATGESKVLKTEIVMDLGRPINKGIDFGQVSGAFAQGMGWCTGEALIYADSGELLSHSPTTYKIPSIQDTPRDFSISFIRNDTNILNVRSSKAVGEPPFLLGLSVWAAIKNALHYTDKKSFESLALPATSEIILENLGEKDLI